MIEPPRVHAGTFCLVTSDSDFSYLCRKLRERGATVYIVGEHKTPDALRNASDRFFEWTPPELPAEPIAEPIAEAVKAGTPRSPSRRSRFPNAGHVASSRRSRCSRAMRPKARST